ncbi:hypothetical protein [Streptomyces sp. NPDC056713]|uniref:hypothetical protein n=1 Tax=Streptomyces sp. NPDC056713 TaxID=3345921 RepID=UPI0036B4E23E
MPGSSRVQVVVIRERTGLPLTLQAVVAALLVLAALQFAQTNRAADPQRAPHPTHSTPATAR